MDNETRTEQPYLSIVVPVYNEEGNLGPLMERLYPAVQGTGRSFEIIFTNDGSRDRSLEILRRMVQQYPGVKVIEFNGKSRAWWRRSKRATTWSAPSARNARIPSSEGPPRGS